MRHKILLIDDTPIMLRLLSNALRSDYDVIVAKDGKQGIANAQKHKPDLILLDLVMPEMSGFEVLQILKIEPETQKIPVMLITGNDSVDDEEKGYGLGALDYIRKPFVASIVRFKVRFVLDYSMMKQKLSELE